MSNVLLDVVSTASNNSMSCSVFHKTSNCFIRSSLASFTPFTSSSLRSFTFFKLFSSSGVFKSSGVFCLFTFESWNCSDLRNILAPVFNNNSDDSCFGFVMDVLEDWLWLSQTRSFNFTALFQSTFRSSLFLFTVVMSPSFN